MLRESCKPVNVRIPGAVQHLGDATFTGVESDIGETLVVAPRFFP